MDTVDQKLVSSRLLSDTLEGVLEIEWTEEGGEGGFQITWGVCQSGKKRSLLQNFDESRDKRKW